MFSLSHFVPSVSQSGPSVLALCAVSLGKTLESCWKISPGKSIIRRFVKNIATAGIQTVAFYTKFMQEILEFWLKEYGRAKSGSTSKQAFYELTKGVMNEFKGIYIHPDLVHFVAEFTPKIMFCYDFIELKRKCFVMTSS